MKDLLNESSSEDRYLAYDQMQQRLKELKNAFNLSNMDVVGILENLKMNEVLKVAFNIDKDE
ncbi:MAG: hypothetical protein CMI54_06260 [Parcubacteria group bacterium]|jgi:hypothetical protein|nr:hypothetical protein [Parcubacteria group bacterium]|tara:strand:- start:17364 stop:17549 length:186 start_codon:yes stop_codon:yes gene_type:complete